MEHLEKLKDFTIHGTYQLPMQIYYQNYPSGGLTVPYHWHKEIELIYVESGSMEMTVNMNSFTAFAGEGAGSLSSPCAVYNIQSTVCNEKRVLCSFLPYSRKRKEKDLKS